jgi:Domain of unknown function (DUF1707)
VQPYMRVSDAERERVVDALQRHTSEGRLTLDEFSSRVEAAQRAVTQADLADLTADLPQPPAPADHTRGRLVTGLVIAGIVVALLLIGAIVTGVAGWGPMGSMMGNCCR